MLLSVWNKYVEESSAFLILSNRLYVWSIIKKCVCDKCLVSW